MPIQIGTLSNGPSLFFFKEADARSHAPALCGGRGKACSWTAGYPRTDVGLAAALSRFDGVPLWPHVGAACLPGTHHTGTMGAL